MDSREEVIALLLGEQSYSRGHVPGLGAQRLIRDCDGNMELQEIRSAEEFDQTARTTGCFRQGQPIYDPETREVIGYELEEVPNVGLAVA